MQGFLRIFTESRDPLWPTLHAAPLRPGEQSRLLRDPLPICGLQFTTKRRRQPLETSSPASPAPPAPEMLWAMPRMSVAPVPPLPGHRAPHLCPALSPLRTLSPGTLYFTSHTLRQIVSGGFEFYFLTSQSGKTEVLLIRADAASRAHMCCCQVELFPQWEESQLPFVCGHFL